MTWVSERRMSEGGSSSNVQVRRRRSRCVEFRRRTSEGGDQTRARGRGCRGPGRGLDVLSSESGRGLGGVSQ